MTQPTDLTTLAAYKQWGGVTGSTDDALLGRLISAASLFILGYLNTNIAQQTYNERRDGWGGVEMPLLYGPVASVSSLVINGQTIPASPDGIAAGYIIFPSSADGITAGLVLAGGYRFTRGRGNVFITYVAGFATTPLDVEQACLELVELRYKQRGRSDVQSKTLQGEVISYKLDAMSDSIIQGLDNYRRVAPV